MRIKCNRCKIGQLYRYNNIDLHKCNNCGKRFTTEDLNHEYNLNLPMRIII